jgi:hypothetical protein
VSRPSVPLADAADMVDRLSERSWTRPGAMSARGALFHVANATGWSVFRIDAALSRRHYDALAAAGTHDAAEYDSPLTEAEWESGTVGARP